MELPRIDISGFLEGDTDAAARCAAELRRALQQVGFFILEGHGIDWPLVDEMYAQARRFHGLPARDKEALRFGDGKFGYLPSGGETSASSEVDESEIRKPNRVESYFVDLESSGKNQWPDTLPGFRDVVLAYFERLWILADRMLPLYAVALNLEPSFFASAFAQPMPSVRMSHYAPTVDPDPDEWGISAHTDRDFMTLLPANTIPGLWVRPEGSTWTPVPEVPETFVVNSGDMLRRWSNDVLLSTPHRVENPATDRYAIPFFYLPSLDAVVEPVSTCVSKVQPARYEPITSGEFLLQFVEANYGQDEKLIS